MSQAQVHGALWRQTLRDHEGKLRESRQEVGDQDHGQQQSQSPLPPDKPSWTHVRIKYSSSTNQHYYSFSSNLSLMLCCYSYIIIIILQLQPIIANNAKSNTLRIKKLSILLYFHIVILYLLDNKIKINCKNAISIFNILSLWLGLKSSHLNSFQLQKILLPSFLSPLNICLIWLWGW